ncbi:MAG: molybdopterin-dependent oxidoreductase [Chlorobiaceae bacterium]|nr:molybdopterin-dependent oxidoreductase [Chlorobiaceae bacterium]
MSHGQNFSRRDFIKISSIFLAGSAAITTATGHAFSGADTPVGDEGSKVVHSFCEHCFWRCGIAAHVRDGKVYKITGSDHHPLSQGKLCPRGTGGTGLLYDPDRLAHPLIRETKGGRQFYRKASWEEAISLVAEKLWNIKEEHGPGALAMLHHGYGVSFFKNMLSQIGVNKYAKPSYDLCCGPARQASVLTYGYPSDTPEGFDMKNSKYMVFFGTHFGENMHNTAVQEISDGIRNGAKIVVFDPRFSTLAGKAEHWLPIKPATDIAMMQGLMHVLISENLYDKAFVEAHTVGFDELRDSVKDMTPEKVTEITDIPADAIRTVAREYAFHAPAAFVHSGRRTNWYGDALQRIRAIHILNALVGNFWMRGGVVKFEKFPLVKPPATHEHPAYEKEAYSKYPFFPQDEPSNTLASHEIIQETIAGNIKGLLIYGVNLPETMTFGREKAIEAMKKAEFVVAVDVLPAEVTGYADVVLPECTYLERYDDLDNGRAFRTPFVALRQPAVSPMYDSKPGNEIAKMITDKWGIHGAFPPSVEKGLDKKLRLVGSSLEEMKKKGVLVMPETDLYRKQGEPLNLNTPSGKVELASAQMKAAGFDAVPKYTPQPEAPAGFYRMLTGRKPMLTFGRTANNRFLGDVATAKENEVWVNNRIAEKHSLQNGEYVHLKNQAGVVSEFPVKVKVTQRIRTDAVYMVHGFGHSAAKLTWAHKRGASHNQLISRTDIDPAMGGVGFQNNFVTFIKEA